MSKIRALNEASSSSESEDEENPRLSTEAQEAQAKRLYEKAQILTISKEYAAAVDTFLEILQLPYLNELEKKNLSPVQLQLRLGCLKCLSTLYTRDPTKSLDDAVLVLELITESEPNNVNFWYRLGKVALEKKDLELAYDAFQRALSCSPGHWGSIENLVTISYALHDLVGCLRFCALGLNKDQAFMKGHVFKQQVFKHHSWVESAVRANRGDFESLFVGNLKISIDKYENNYLQEARDLMYQVRQRKEKLKKEEKDEANKVVKCPFLLQFLNLVSLGDTTLKFYQHLKNNDTLLRPVEMTTAIPETATREELKSEKIITVNGDFEEQSCSSVIRSRSTSYDKEPGRDSGGDSSRTVNESSQLSEGDEKLMEEDSQAVLQGQSNAEDEMFQKKTKSRRDMKWWQMEGKRRSQRVRGNMVSIPTKPKPESTFAETLRNIIPVELLADETKPCKDGFHVKPVRSQSHIVVERTYFGTIEEENDVKNFLSLCNDMNILQVITHYVRWISKINKGSWPCELRKVFTTLYRVYRNSIPMPSIFETEKIDFAMEQLEDDAFTVLTDAEISFESGGTVCAAMFFLDTSHFPTFCDEYYLRLEWLKVKNCLQQCQQDAMDYAFVSCHLNCILDLLRKHPSDFLCFVPTEHDFVISKAHINEKLQFVQKIENLSKIEELYTNKEYEDLVEILVFSLSSDNPGEFQHRVYLTESYFHLRKTECVAQCEVLMDAVIKNGPEEKLPYILDLMDRIWNEMKEEMGLDECKIFINVLLKMLIQIEKRQLLSTDSIMTKPWCLLHSVLYHTEKTEPAFSTDDENLPSSILVLQLGHEILSKIAKCCANDGYFLSYSIRSLLELQNNEEYWSFEETTVCLEQAILCLYGHQSKKLKSKALKDHGSAGIPLNWAACCQLYNYYRVEELPEFDSKPNKSISAEVEALFLRIISEMPSELKPTTRHNKMKDFVEGGAVTTTEEPLNMTTFPLETFDIYYLLADYYLKNQDLNKAVDFYIWDLAVCPLRFDSWTAIALAKVEDIVSKINACDAFKVEEIMFHVDAVIRCFRKSLDLDIANSKVRIEFGSFLYSLHSVYSRELKFHASKLSPELQDQVDQKQKAYLLQARDWFEPYKTPLMVAMDQEDDSMHEEAWINHYMLGKVEEKLHPTEPEKFISQYDMALRLLHEKCSTYPAKISYYTPPDYALESLEVYYRIHASILRYLENVKEYNKDSEQILMNFVSEAEESPFVKSRQGRKNEDDTKRKKAVEDGISKKEMTVINNLMKQILDKVDKIVAAGEESKTQNAAGTTTNSSSTTSSGETSTSSDEDSNGNAQPTELPAMNSYSLSAFRDRIREEDAAKLSMEKLKNADCRSKAVSDTSQSNKDAGGSAEDNQYLKDFAELPYGTIVSKCLKAMKECTSRYPQCFKAYFRLAHAFVFFKKDYKKAKQYLMGNSASGADKISGLYGERKPSNFFHGVWRHPVEDIDRPGSFAFHMSNCIQLLLKVLGELRDHQMLAEVGIQLSKVPDSKNTYLYTEDREQYSREAFKLCEIAARKSISKNPANLINSGLSIYETYLKFQKFNPKENVAAPVLLDVYIRYSDSQNNVSSNWQVSDAVRFFQQWMWSTKTQAVVTSSYKRPSLKPRLSADPTREHHHLLPPTTPKSAASPFQTPHFQPTNPTSTMYSEHMLKYNTNAGVDQMWAQLMTINPFALQLQIQSMLPPRPNKEIMRPLDTIQKSTSMYQGLPTSSSPNVNASTPQYVNSSPFQAQSAVMANPGMTGRGSHVSKDNHHQALKTPQPAHSQARTLPRLETSTHEPEVVDLTTKSPEKATNNLSQDVLEKGGIDRPRNSLPKNNREYHVNSQTSISITSVGPQIGKPKPRVAPPKTKINWELAEQYLKENRMTLPSNQFPKVVSTLAPVNKPLPPPPMSLVPDVSVIKSNTPKIGNDTKLQMSTSTGVVSKSVSQRSNFPDVTVIKPNTLQILTTTTPSNKLAPKLVNLPQLTLTKNPVTTNFPSSDVAHSSQNATTFPQTTVIQSSTNVNPPLNRPQKRPLPNVDQAKQYPLPPKKKHFIRDPVILPQPDPDVEVITLE